MRLRAGNQPAAGANDACGRTKLNAGQDFRIFKDTSLNMSKNNTTLDNRLATSQCSHTRILSSVGQFARVVKGVDLRSTAGNCAWVRTPQLTNVFCTNNRRMTALRETNLHCEIALGRKSRKWHEHVGGRAGNLRATNGHQFCQNAAKLLCTSNAVLLPLIRHSATMHWRKPATDMATLDRSFAYAIICNRKGMFNWPRGPMDKASAYGAGDCRFESCRGHFALRSAHWGCSAKLVGQLLRSNAGRFGGANAPPHWWANG